MIITCPHCQTKYQVTYEAIGSVGRKVQCAHCQQAWQQDPVKAQDSGTPAQKAAFEAIAEDGLDEVMVAEEKAVAAEVNRRLAEEAERRKVAPGKVDPAVIRKRQKAFSKRQNVVAASLPLARLRRTARIAAALALVGVLATAYFGRVEVVQRYPAMAGVYEAVGLGINVVGLDFTNVTTLRTLRDGKEVLVVSAQIIGLTPSPTPVPAVVVTLVGASGQGVYEWSVAPSVRDLMAGERSTFETQLVMPPGDASRVRLSFAGGSSIRESGAQPIAEVPPAAEPSEPIAAEAEQEAAVAPEHPAPEHH